MLGGELQGQSAPAAQSPADVQCEPGRRCFLDDLVNSRHWSPREYHGLLGDQSRRSAKWSRSQLSTLTLNRSPIDEMSCHHPRSHCPRERCCAWLVDD